MEIFNEIYHYRKKWGTINGLKILLRFKTNRLSGIRLPHNPYPVHLRPGTSDIPTFYQVYWHEEYNIPLPFQPEFIIDAGANIGLAAIWYAQHYPNAQIISVEPEQSNFDQMLINTKLCRNVVCLKAAIDPVNDGTLNILDSGEGNWAFTTGRSVDENSRLVDQVRTRSLDSIMSEFGRDIIDILKIDIEGAEKELFETGFEKWLPRSRCVVIETHDRIKKGCSEAVEKAISKFSFERTERGENVVFLNREL